MIVCGACDPPAHRGVEFRIPAVASLDLSSWYADRALVSMAVLVAIIIYGAATALGGKPIFGDPLRETSAR